MVAWSLSKLPLLAILLMCLVSLASPGPGAPRNPSLHPLGKPADRCSWLRRIASTPRRALSLRGGVARRPAVKSADLTRSPDPVSCGASGSTANDSQHGEDVAGEPQPSPILRGQDEQPTKVHADPERGCDQTGDGSRDLPVASLFAALSIAVQQPVCEVVLASGRYSGKMNTRLRVALAPRQRLHLSFSPSPPSSSSETDSKELAVVPMREVVPGRQAIGEEGGRAVLVGGGRRFLLNVTGGSGSEFSASGLRFQDAGSSLLVGGNVTVRCVDCSFLNHSRGALRAAGRSRLWLQHCLFQANNLSIPVPPPESMQPDPPLVDMMGAALSIQGKVRARVLACGFWDNGGVRTLAGGAVVVNTSHSNPAPAQVLFRGCVFQNNSAADAGGAMCMLLDSCCNISDSWFYNNSAWGILRGGGGIYAEGRQLSWVWNCSFVWNLCPETGGAITVMGKQDVPDDPELYEEEEPEEGQTQEPQGRVIDFRKCLFDNNYPAWYFWGPIYEAFESDFIPGGNIGLWEKADKLPTEMENEDESDDARANLTLPWELADDLAEMQDDWWKEQFPFGDSGLDEEQLEPFRQPAHWDTMEPDPDTGVWDLPAGFRDYRKDMRMSEYKNQSAVQTYLRLEKTYGANASETLNWLTHHAEETLRKTLDEEYAPEGGYPPNLEPTSEEWAWCEEPLAALAAWSKIDTDAYYAKSQGWEKWDEEEMLAWKAERKVVDEEYDQMEWDAWDEYAKRRGYKGIVKPVHQTDITDDEQVWDEHLSEDIDPARHPEYQWNRPPTQEELWREGGPMRDLNADDIRKIREGGKGRKRKPPRGLGDGEDDEEEEEEEEEDDDGSDAGFNGF